MRKFITVCSFILMLSVPASIQQAGTATAPAARKASAKYTRATLLTAGTIRTRLSKMNEDPPNQEHTVVERIGVWRLSVEHRKLPQRPALHQEEGEMWAVIEGTATLRTGGTLEGTAAPTAGTATQAPGNVFGKQIAGGADHQVGPGD